MILFKVSSGFILGKAMARKVYLVSFDVDSSKKIPLF